MLRRGDSFLACFPLFAPVPGDRKVETINPKDLAPVVAPVESGEQVLIFFTDEDLVNRYLARVDPASLPGVGPQGTQTGRDRHTRQAERTCDVVLDQRDDRDATSCMWRSPNGKLDSITRRRCLRLADVGVAVIC